MRKGSRLKRVVVYDELYDEIEIWKSYCGSGDFELPGKWSNGYIHYGKKVIGWL